MEVFESTQSLHISTWHWLTRKLLTLSTLNPRMYGQMQNELTNLERRSHSKTVHTSISLVTCQRCEQSVMIRAARKGGWFSGCTSFPQCGGPCQRGGQIIKTMIAAASKLDRESEDAWHALVKAQRPDLCEFCAPVNSHLAVATSTAGRQHTQLDCWIGTWPLVVVRREL